MIIGICSTWNTIDFVEHDDLSFTRRTTCTLRDARVNLAYFLGLQTYPPVTSSLTQKNIFSFYKLLFIKCLLNLMKRVVVATIQNILVL